MSLISTRRSFAGTSPDHYVDMEMVPAGAFNVASRYDFIVELLKSGRKPADAGFLPYRMLEMFQRMRVEFRLWRAEKDLRRRLWIEQRIINDAGVLGHYVSDGSNPHHTTIHHNGWVGAIQKVTRPIRASAGSTFASRRNMFRRT